MALPNGGGGYQLGSGNLSEIVLGYDDAPATATATATLTVAQVTSKLLVANPAAAVIYTLPTATEIDAAVPSAHVGSTFDLNIVNIATAANTVTFALGTGVTSGGNSAVAIAGAAGSWLRFRKTGDAAWVVYKLI